MDVFVFDYGGFFILCQFMFVCMSEGDQVDVCYIFDGGELCVSGEMLGKMVVMLINVDGCVEYFWEVNNEIFVLSDNYVVKVFNVYCCYLVFFFCEFFLEKVVINSVYGDVFECCNGKNIIL